MVKPIIFFKRINGDYMGRRKLYLERYIKAIKHLKCNSEIEELYFNEIIICIANIKAIKGAKGTESYFNHIDFILRDIFGVEVQGVKESVKPL